MILLDARVFVIDVQRRGHLLRHHAGTEPRSRLAVCGTGGRWFDGGGTGPDEGADGRDRAGIDSEEMRYPVPSQAASNVISNQGRHARAEGAGKIKLLYAIFFVLLVTGWHELPGDDSILPWYVRLCST